MSVIFGTNGDDNLTGSGFSDLIISGRGDDVIDAGDGNDLVLAGKGDDIVDGGAGNDIIFGGRGDDTLNGGAGSDLIFAGKGDDTVIYNVEENGSAYNWFDGGKGLDTLQIRLTQDQLDEMTGAGVLDAFAQVAGTFQFFDFSRFGLSFDLNLKVTRIETLEFDIISSGPDSLFTANADVVDFNTVVAGSYLDGTQYDGLAGDDTVVLANSAAAAAAAGFVVGTAFNAGDGNDTVTGGALDNIINGDAGNDTISGGLGLDVLDGGAGDDLLILDDIAVGDMVEGGSGNDTFAFTAADGTNHLLSASATTVSLDGTQIAVTGVENYQFNGGDGNDFIAGRDGDDVLTGAAGNDQLQASTGIDQLFGGAGNDILVFSDVNDGELADGGVGGFDDFRFIDNTATNNTITAAANAVTVDGQTVQLVDIERILIQSGAGDDTITGSSLGDLIRGEADNDIINGGDGNDILEGGTGIDQLFGGLGNDILTFNDVNNGDLADGGVGGFDDFRYLDNSNVANTITATASAVNVDGQVAQLNDIERILIQSGGGADTINGSSLGDLIRGEGDNDTIIGGAGNDQLEGGDGNDTITGGLDNDTLLGGAGDDLFIFNAGDGGDQIGDFVAGAGTDDVVDVSFRGFSAFDDGTTNDVESALTQVGNNVRLDLGGGDSILFASLTVANFDAGDFII
ncbi:MAG: calcium-binding protein [Pseudomonadota bacterium]